MLRNGWAKWALGILGALIVAGGAGWVGSVQAAKDFTIRAEERAASQERRITKLEEYREADMKAITTDLTTIKEQVATIRGYLEAQRR